jgi:MEDS: MEthanogen/methylotroph, DcmR Sensory domain
MIDMVFFGHWKPRSTVVTAGVTTKRRAVVAESLTRGAGEHTVVFYHDNELASVVGGYLLHAIRHGGVAIILATPEHRIWVNAWLMHAGVDLATATTNGSYVVLDARQTMDGFVIGEWPDPASFWSTLSPVLAAAARRRRPVRVFGEMVALLWEAGHTDAAIELEALWNEMARQHTFALLCGYPLAAVDGAEYSDALSRLRDSHSGSIGPAGPTDSIGPIDPP